ncbi:MAG: ATP-binding cassette domain-containing protein [Oscillospiraceae bacterium]|nr:ATP-binding cassette domain-containing protein [Oscillospiraceae bacterium]
MSIEVNIQKTLGQFHLDVAFSAENEVLALLGGSGCGKSMTLRCIAGIEKPDQGRIVVNGVPYFDSEKRINLPPQKRRVGMLFQNYALFPNMTVEQNILTGLKRVKSRAARQERLHAAIETFHLQGLEKHLPHELSGGQQQRVALARILVGEPTILMLDEPFSALDSYLRWEMEHELNERLQAFTGTTLFVSHSRDEVFRISDRVAVYGHGTIEVVDRKEEVFANPHTWQAAMLTGCQNLSMVSPGDGSTVHADSWDLDLTPPEGVAFDCVGIRAYDLRAAQGPGKNTFAYEVVQEVPDTLDTVRMIRRKGSNPTELIRWVVPRDLEASIPLTGYVQLPDEGLMWLKK